MQQIINFIFKNSYKLLFLLLLGISLTLTIKSHSYHRSEYINTANSISGSVYQKIDNANEYLSLREKNLRLAEENALLKEILFNKKDTTLPSKNIHSEQLSDINVRMSKVIKNVFNTRENYLTLNSGSIDSIKKYIENQFEAGMSWSNHGIFSWHLDHIKPVSKFNLLLKEEQKQMMSVLYKKLQYQEWPDLIDIKTQIADKLIEENKYCF